MAVFALVASSMGFGAESEVSRLCLTKVLVRTVNLYKIDAAALVAAETAGFCVFPKERRQRLREVARDFTENWTDVFPSLHEMLAVSR
jgi:hypothetical protein